MTRFRKAMWWIAISILAGTPLAAQTEHQQHHPPQDAGSYIAALEAPSRDAWQQPEKVMAALALKQGEHVADIGSGPGYFTLRFARPWDHPAKCTAWIFRVKCWIILRNRLGRTTSITFSLCLQNRTILSSSRVLWT